MTSHALETMQLRQKAEAVADALAPRFADHLCDVVQFGRMGVHAARASYLVESVLRDEKLIATMWGAVTPLGREVVTVLHERKRVTPLSKSVRP